MEEDLSFMEMSSNDVDSIFATLEEAMELEEIECRIVVSSMVREAITRGVLRALAEESEEQLANKDLELRKLRDILKDKESMIGNLEKDLVVNEERIMQQARDLLLEKENMEAKWRENEFLLAQKENELTRMAQNLVEMSSILAVMSNDLRHADSSGLKDVVDLLDEIESMKENQDSSYMMLKIQSQPKELKLNRSIDQLEALLLEKNNEVHDLEMILSQKETLVDNLRKQVAEGNVEVFSKTDKFFQVNSATKDEFEEHKLLTEVEQELLTILFEGKVLDMAEELGHVYKKIEEHILEKKNCEVCNTVEYFKSSAKGIMNDMELAHSSQDELVNKEKGTLLRNYELFRKLDKDLPYLKGAVNETSNLLSWEKEISSNMENEMKEQSWRFEAERDLLCTYWQSLVNFMQAENACLCKELYAVKQILHDLQPNKSKMSSLMKGMPEVADLESSLESSALGLEGRLTITKAEVNCLVEALEESKWKNDVEIMLILNILENLYREFIMELYFCRKEIDMKDEEIFCLDLEVAYLKQAWEGLEIGFDVLKSTYTTQVIDESRLGDDPEAGLVQLTSDKQNNCGVVQAEGGESRKNISEGSEANKISLLQMTEELAGKMLQHELEMDIITQILEQKDQEAAECVLVSTFTIDEVNLQAAKQRKEAERALQLQHIEATSLQSELKMSSRFLEELKLQLEFLIHNCSLKLKTLELRCSVELSKFEKLAIAIKSLCNQTKGMKRKISVVKEEREQQKWRHEIENEFLVLVLMESLGEMHKRWKAADVFMQDTELSKIIIQGTGHIAALEVVDDNWKSNKGQNHQRGLRKKMESSVLGNTSKDELISCLKREVAELKREKEQMVAFRTEEIYKLKREFWKATEKGRLPSRSRDVEGLSKWFSEGSAWLEQLCKEAGVLQVNSGSSKLREDWNNEKISLLENISIKERDLKAVTSEVSELTEVEKSQRTKILKLSARNVELEAEREQLVLHWRNKYSSLQIEKEELLESILKRERKIEQLDEKLAMMLEREKGHDVIESQLHEKLAMMLEREKEHDAIESRLQEHVHKLENEKQHSVAEWRKVSLSESHLRKDLEAEKASLQETIIQRERDMGKLTADLTELARRESHMIEQIKELEIEKSQLLGESGKILEIELGKKESEFEKLTEVEKNLRREISKLSARIAELESERENLVVHWKNKDSSLQIEKEELLETIDKRERNIEQLNEELVVMLEKENDHDAVESQPGGHIHKLETEKQELFAECRKASLSESKLREEMEAEKATLQELVNKKEMDIGKLAADLTELAGRECQLLEHIKELESEKPQLLGNSHKMVETEIGKKESELEEKVSELSANIEKLENEREQLLASKVEQFRQEWQIQKADLLETISQKERDLRKVSESLTELLKKEKDHAMTEAKLLRHVANLEIEKEELIMGQRDKEPFVSLSLKEKDEALALAIRDKRKEEESRKVLEKEVDQMNKMQKLNQHVEALRKQDRVVQGDVQLCFAEQIDRFVEASQRFEDKITHKVQEKITRLDTTKEELFKLKRIMKSFEARESQLKAKLGREINNLRKAEAEVDLLGDEVDMLMDLLEKAYAALALYAPIFQHCPEIRDVSRVIGQELQLRLDPT